MSIDERIADRISVLCSARSSNAHEYDLCVRAVRAALADPAISGGIENVAYERAAEICDTWSGYKTYQGDAQGACDDCAAAIRRLKEE